MFTRKLIIPMTVEVSKVCRTCLGIESKLLSIYQTKGISNTETVSDMLAQLTSTPPKKYDGFPENVCLDCIREINLCYLFKMKCEHSYSIFKHVLHGSPEEQQVIPDKIETAMTNNVIPQSDSETQTITPAPADNSNIVPFVQTENKAVSPFLIICPNNEAKEFETKANDSKKDESVFSNPNAAVVVENLLLQEGVVYSYEESNPINNSVLETSDSTKEIQIMDDDESTETFNRDDEDTGVFLRGDDDTEVLQMDDDDSTHQLLSLLEREITDNDGEDIHHAKEYPDYSDNNACENELNFNEEALQEPPISSSSKKINGDPLPCEVCGKVYHNDKMTARKKPPHKCKYCKETFLNISCYKLHLMRHENKPFQCGDCDKSFASSEELRAHGLIHEEVFPYVCSLCCSGFRHKTSLKSHIRTHMKPKQYNCPHCPKKLTSLSSLKTHHNVHTNEGVDIEEMNDCKYCRKLFIKTIQRPDSDLI